MSEAQPQPSSVPPAAIDPAPIESPATTAPAITLSAPELPGHAAIKPATEAGIVLATWAAEAEAELKKIPFFVRGKARRNTERFALERGVALITVETLYDAKSHFGR